MAYGTTHPSPPPPQVQKYVANPCHLLIANCTCTRPFRFNASASRHPPSSILVPPYRSSPWCGLRPPGSHGNQVRSIHVHWSTGTYEVTWRMEIYIHSFDGSSTRRVATRLRDSPLSHPICRQRIENIVFQAFVLDSHWLDPHIHLLAGASPLLSHLHQSR
jgi:hypothetical protein